MLGAGNPQHCPRHQFSNQPHRFAFIAPDWLPVAELMPLLREWRADLSRVKRSRLYLSEFVGNTRCPITVPMLLFLGMASTALKWRCTWAAKYLVTLCCAWFRYAR